MDSLFTMGDFDLDTEFLVYVLSEVLCAIDAAVLSACAAEAEHERGEPSLNVAADVCVGKPIDTVEEGEYLAVVLKESDHRLVESRKFLVWLIASGVVGAAAVENVATTVSRRVLRYALAVREAEDVDHEWTVAVVFGKGCRSVLRVSLVDVFLCHLVSVGSVCSGLLYACELWQLGESAERIHKVRVGETVEFQ